MTKILITGATGQLGGAVIDDLLRDIPADDLIATTRDPGSEAARALAARGVTVRRADYEDPETLAGAFDGADVALIISGLAPPITRAAGHARAFEAAAQAGVGHLVYTSLPDPVEDNPFPYAPDHGLSEASLKETGVPFTILRNAFYADNLGGQVAGGTIITTEPDAAAAWALRDDLAAGAAAVLRDPPAHAGEVYDLTGRVAQTPREVAAETGAALTVVTTDQQAQALADNGLPPVVVGIIQGGAKSVAQGRYTEVSPDLENLIGRPPGTVAEAYSVPVST